MAQSKRHVYEEQAADQNICRRFGSEKSEEVAVSGFNEFPRHVCGRNQV